MTDGLEAALQTVRRELETSCAESGRAARAQLLRDMHELLRRFRSYGNEDEWVALLVEGASRFVLQFALFMVRESSLELGGERGLDLPDALTIDTSAAQAMAAAIRSKDVVVALRTVSEFGAVLSIPETGARAYAVPVVNGQRVVALLFAPLSAEADIQMLEFLAGMASIVLERRSNAALAVQIAPLAPTVETVPKRQSAIGERRLADWADLSEDERNLQMRAQRFARIKVAEVQLAHPDAARAGREQNNVYLFLKSGIDAARESYRAQFMRDKSMIDYFHLELVRIAAEGEETKLGAEYPGPLA